MVTPAPTGSQMAPPTTHWIRFKLRPGVCLKHLSVQVARSDQSYMPQHVTVLTGHSPVSLQEVTEIRIARWAL